VEGLEVVEGCGPGVGGVEEGRGDGEGRGVMAFHCGGDVWFGGVEGVIGGGSR
jgi:hypothetical protein